MQTILMKLIRNQSGVTAIEYALIGMLVALVIITAVSLAGTSLSSDFHNVAVSL